MPEANGSQDIGQQPRHQTPMQPPPQSPENQDPPPKAADRNSRVNDSQTREFEKKIKAGEYWLISIGIATILVNIGIWQTYSGQLREMRKATEATAEALKLAQDSSVTSGNDFDRTMLQTIHQTAAQGASAKAAQDAADVAIRSLHISERAYIVTALPEINSAEKSMTIPFQNIGHIPSGAADLVVHWATVDILNPSVGGRFDQAIDKSCSRAKFDTLTPSFSERITIPLVQMSDAAMIGGHQLTVVAGTITYNDGFPRTPKQIFQFCFRSGYQASLNKVYWRACDAKLHITALEKVDGYPNCTNAGIDH